MHYKQDIRLNQCSSESMQLKAEHHKHCFCFNVTYINFIVMFINLPSRILRL